MGFVHTAPHVHVTVLWFCRTNLQNNSACSTESFCRTHVLWFCRTNLQNNFACSTEWFCRTHRAGLLRTRRPCSCVWRREEGGIMCGGIHFYCTMTVAGPTPQRRPPCARPKERASKGAVRGRGPVAMHDWARYLSLPRQCNHPLHLLLGIRTNLTRMTPATTKPCLLGPAAATPTQNTGSHTQFGTSSASSCSVGIIVFTTRVCPNTRTSWW